MTVYDDSRLVVNVARLVETSGHIQTAVTTLEAQLAQLERDAAPLVRTWNGAARAAYDERQAAWRQASGELAMMLRAIKAALDESVLDYSSTEQRNTALFR